MIVFEWVAGNGAPANLTNINPLLAQGVLAGAMPLSQFTGLNADSGTIVYAAGRDFDSGTRVSQLAESGISVFGGVQQVQPIITGGSAGTASATMSGLQLWPAATVLGQAFAIGNSGFASGGTLADNLATPGSGTANTTTGIPAAQQLAFGPGFLVGYLGRNDAARACKTSVIAGNTARRLTWNGAADWNGTTFTSAGVPTGGYNDAAVQEGLYSLWEYEWLAYRTTIPANPKAVADAIAARIINFDATVSGIKLSTMNVSKPVEGGLITHL